MKNEAIKLKNVLSEILRHLELATTNVMLPKSKSIGHALTAKGLVEMLLAKPTCEKCGGSRRIREKSVNTESYIWVACPDCPPKEPKPAAGELVAELRRLRLLFTNNVGEKPYYRCEDKRMNVYVADDQMFCTIYSPDFQGEYDEEIPKAICDLGKTLEAATNHISQLEKNQCTEPDCVVVRTWQKTREQRAYLQKENKQQAEQITELKAKIKELELAADLTKYTKGQLRENEQLKKQIVELQKEKAETSQRLDKILEDLNKANKKVDNILDIIAELRAKETK